MFLDQIVAHKKEEIALRKQLVPLPELKRKAYARTASKDFLQALKVRSGGVTRIIAEVKKASPSLGVIREDFDPGLIGALYGKAGAVALSVLTDQKFFQGELDHLSQVRKVTNLPLLCKDFIIDPYQLYEAAVHGADGFLAIATLLTDKQMEEFLCLGRELNMEALVEVHTEEDLEKVLHTSATIVGINNRDLRTFNIDTMTTLKLLPAIPPGRLVVSESGISSRRQIEKLEAAGVHAFLIGEALMGAKNPGKKLRELRGERDDQN